MFRRNSTRYEPPRPAPIEPRRALRRLWPVLLAALLLGLKLLLPGLEPRKPAAHPPPSAPSTPYPAAGPPADDEPAPDGTPLARSPGQEPETCPKGCTEPPPGCSIKGNVSLETGERIYHLPGQKYYARTIIRPEYGERWFCTEQEARANGWRKSKR